MENKNEAIQPVEKKNEAVQPLEDEVLEAATGGDRDLDPDETKCAACGRPYSKSANRSTNNGIVKLRCPHCHHVETARDFLFFFF